MPLLQLAAVATLTTAGSLTLLAGEPIQFSREKPRPALHPEETGRLSKEVSRQPKGLVPNNPMDGFQSVNPEVRPRDPRDERRRKAADNERKNWMFHERGEGRDREEEELGIRDYSLEKDDGTGDSIFTPKANDSRTVGRPRLPSSLSRLPNQDQDEAPPARPPEPVKDAKHAGPEDQPHDPAGGDHVSKDLDLRTLLSGGKSSRADSAEAGSWNARPGELAARSRDDQEPRRGDLNGAGPLPGGARLAGLGDALGAGNNAIAPRATPSSLVPAAPRSSELNNPLDRNLGGGASLSRPGFDSGFDRSFKNPNSLYPRSLSEPYYNSPGASPGFGSPSEVGQRPPQNSAPNQSPWGKSRIPRP